jgi:hypothetical protein
MPRRSIQGDPDKIRSELVDLLKSFKDQLKSGTLRERVLALIPAVNLLKDLGCSLIPKTVASSAPDRILAYLREYPLTIIRGQELEVVGGISEWARRVRELRVQFGWNIISGKTAREMLREGELAINGVDLSRMKPDEYILLSAEEDREGAHRWNVANEIRKGGGSVSDRMLAYLRKNVGRAVTGEELRYVAKNKTEWARRVRELRTEHGWPVITKTSGNPDLPVGVYVLEEDRQAPEHDRKIPDAVRTAVLRRDGHACVECGWSHSEWTRSAPRHLELHHIKPHVEKGANTENNLQTLCTVCHDAKHRR